MSKILLFFLILTFAPAVVAAPTPSETVRVLGFEGEKLFNDGLFRQARDRWEKGLALARQGRTPPAINYFLTNLGAAYCELGEYANAVSCANEALKIAGELKDRSSIASNYGSLGNAYASMGDYEQALALYEKALENFRQMNDRRKTATALNNIGNIHAKRGDYPAAQTCYEQAFDIVREIRDRVGIGNTLANLGTLHEKRGEYQRAVGRYEEALAVFKEFNYRQGIAANYTNLGVVYSDQGDYAGAIASFEEALRITKLLGNKDAMAENLLNLGTAYKNIGDYWKSADYCERGLALFKDTGNGPKIMASLAGLGTLYAELGDFSKAMSCYEESMVLARQQGDRTGIGSNFLYLGMLCRQMGDDDKAVEYFRKAREIRNAAKLSAEDIDALIADICLAEGRLDIAEQQYLRLKDPVRLGRLELARGRYDKAIGYFSSALEDDNKNHDAKFLFADYCGLGHGFLGLGEYKKAKEHYEKAIAMTEEQRETLGDGDRSRFFSVQMAGFYRTEPYEGMVRTMVNMRDFDGAFYYSENLKARVLLEAIARGHAQVAREIDPVIASDEEKYRARIHSLRKEMESLFRNRQTDRYDELAKELKEWKARQDTFISALRKQYPEYASVSYPRPLHLREVSLKDGEHLLEFEITDARCYLFIISGNGKLVDMRVIPKSRRQLQEQVLRYRSCFENIEKMQDLSKFNVQASADLYRVLFGNTLDAIPKNASVIIVPDEILGVLSFESLVIKAGGQDKVGENAQGPFPLDVQYFGDRFSVTYAQSATSLMVLRSLKKETVQSDRALVVCDPLFSVNDRRGGINKTRATGKDRLRHMGALYAWKAMGVEGTRPRPLADGAASEAFDEELFPRLEKTREIARNMEQLFGEHTVVFSGVDAKEENIDQLHFSDYRYIVFATHGILDETIPWIRQPALVLTQVGNREDRDGFLTLTEVMRLKIPAEVVALTACETGVGKQLRGEGVMGMGKAFQFAGAGNVLMSLWAVSEDATVALANAFFKELKAGKDAREALRSAREEIRRDGYEHPFYWASFILMSR